MPVFEWSLEKNERLKEERGISFEDVVLAIESGKVLDRIPHPNPKKYRSQFVFIIEMKGYVYRVPFVQQKNGMFLKTVYPSRDAFELYKNKIRNL